MSQEYFPPKSKATATEEHSPALPDADEEFFKRFTSPDPNQKIVIFDEKGKARGSGVEVAEQVPLPASPPPVVEEPAKGDADKKKAKDKAKAKDRLSGFFTTVRSHIPVSFGKVCLRCMSLMRNTANELSRKQSRPMQALM